MSKPREKKQEEGAPEWMLTYGDMVTLLLTFFVMLYSMANLDKQKYVQVANSIRSTFMSNSNGEMFYNNNGKELFSILEEQNYATHEDQDQVVSENKQQPSATGKTLSQNAKNLDTAEKQIKESINSMEMNKYVTIIENSTSVTIRVNSAVLFDLGEAEIKSKGSEVLKRIGNSLKGLNHEIIIQGHTDNLPINTYLYPSNWELSTKRATNVVVFLINNCSLDPKKLTATGNGEFRPISPNDTEENRQKNRRIDIVVVK